MAEPSIRGKILEFPAQGADHLPRADTEVLKQLGEKLKSISNTQKGRYREMVQLLLDVIDDVLSSEGLANRPIFISIPS